MKKIKLTDAIDLMLRCIKSCNSIEQLDMVLEWIESYIMPERFREQSPEYVLKAKGELFEIVRIHGQKLFGIGDNDEVEILVSSIHPQ